MANTSLSRKVMAQIDRAVDCYKNKVQDYDNLIKKVIIDFTNHSELENLIHSSKFRTKDPDHLQDKLIRQANQAKQNGKEFKISEKK